MSDKLIVERLQDLRICDIGLRRVAAKRIKALTEQYEEAYQYALHLAEALRENYPPNPDFRFLGDLVGLLTQIDNMVAGLPQPDAREAALRDIARQKKTDEMDTEYDVEYADFEGGYNAIIDVARVALRAVQPAHVNEMPKSEHDTANVLTPATKGDTHD